VFLFSFAGKIRAPVYAALSLATFFSQHVLVYALFRLFGRPLNLDLWFLATPLTSLAALAETSPLITVVAIAYLLLAAWVLAALAFRRAADANVSGWVIPYVIAPIIQILVVIALCVLPSRPSATAEISGEPASTAPSRIAAAAQGMIAGMALTLLSVAVGALIFGTYGFGMFVVSPFVIGAMTGYFGNRQIDLGVPDTLRLVVTASVIGGIALIAAALEGAVCIILAAPLGLGLALVGGLAGRAVALSRRSSPAATVSAVALLLLVFALESVLTRTVSFDTTETVEINAPAAIVWTSILRMDPMDQPPGLPFRLGVAYPLGGEITGEGMGAIRRGAFSTGTAIERVTEWEPERRLTLAVVEDVPAMRELSPYEHVHAPHVIGYFRTSRISFEIMPRGNGRSSVIECTSHELKLEPAFYWLPLARYVIRTNNTRVLEHIRLQAEGRARNASQ
jgi:hypothetical protein